MTGQTRVVEPHMSGREPNERVRAALSELLGAVFNSPREMEEWYTGHVGDPRQLRLWRSGRVIIEEENWNKKFANWLEKDFGRDLEFCKKLANVKVLIDEERLRSQAAQRRGKSPESADSQVKADNAARDVLFWHTFRNRDHAGKGVRDLIATAQQRVVVTGGSLDQCVWRFRNELRMALDRNVLVGLAMADPSSEDALRLYVRYADSLLKLASLTENRYKEFYKSLAPAQRQRFSFSYTELPLTHSLGLYDDQIFLSEFCIDRHSEECPSYAVVQGSPSYGVFLYEIHTILKESRCVLGTGKEKLISNIAADAKRTPHYRP